MRKRPFNILLLIIFSALAWLPQPLRAETSLPLTHGTIIRDYARVTFEWPKPVYFTAVAKGKIVTITFDRKADPDFGPLLSQLYPYITHAERKGDGRTIVLTLDKPYRIRTFISDNISGIDILSIDPEARNEARRAPPSEPSTPMKSKPHSLANLAPSAGTAEAAKPQETAKAAEPVKPAEPEKPAEPAKAAEAVKPVEPAQAEALAPSAKAPETAPAPAAPAAPAENTANDSAALPPAEAAAKAAAITVPSGPIKIGLSAGQDNATVRFPFAERVAMSAFIRAHTLWIVFNKPLTFDLSDFDSASPTIVGKPQILPGTSVSVLRLPLDNNVYASISREEGSFEWAVLLTMSPRLLSTPLKVDINTDPPAPPHVFIPVLETADPVTVRDPQVGDELVVTPLYGTSEGLGAKREFVEFSLLETVQGVVVAKKSDEVQVVPLRNGLRISLPQGATLTPGLPELSENNKAASLQTSATLFPYDTWKLEDNVNRRQQLRTLLHSVVESSDVQAANAARLRIAQIYLSEGLAVEAIAMLDGINRTNPVYYRSAKLAALHGAANFLMYRFPDAARDFSGTELNNNKEVEYWRSMLADLLGNPGAYDYIALNADYISKYPPIFRQRLAIVASDRAIASKEYNMALKIFDTLHQDHILEPITPYVNFLLAKISADTDQEKDALAMWDKLAADYKHPFVQARAEFSRIAWGMEHATLSKDQIIDRLERLRLAWHGDSLELKVLSLLGELYAEQKDYVSAMRTWNGGVTSFPNTAAAVDMSHKMEEAFLAMFKDGAADSLPTLDALSIYYEYRNFAPPGDVGNVMIDRLSDRLVAVDLLEQAAALLDHQMHFQLEHEQRSRLGAKLATIQLLNHQPKKALQALEDSVYGENPAQLRMLRNRIAAAAMSDLGQSDKALQILGQDDSADAERIRLGIYWHEKDWPRVTASVEAMLKARKDTSAPITLDETDYVLKLALAYVFQNNTAQLTYLRDYFGPLMTNNPNKQIFDFITAGDIVPTPTNFDEVIKNLSDTRSFIDNYKARIQTAGLTAVTNGTEPAKGNP